MRLEAAIDKILKNIEPAKKEEVSKYYQQNLFK
jgi:hypothetical protein